MKLTANQIRYLLVVRKLNETKHIIKSVDIARELDYSRASVHKMMKLLMSMGYIVHDSYSDVQITNSGIKVANDCHKKYETIKEELKDVISSIDDYNLGICYLIESMRN